MLIKTVKITNPRNVLVQIPSLIVATWNLTLQDKLEVRYDEERGEITIRPHLHGRRGTAEESKRMA